VRISTKLTRDSGESEQRAGERERVGANRRSLSEFAGNARENGPSRWSSTLA